MALKFKNGIETTTVKVTNGTLGVNKVLTSDASGNAAWADVAKGYVNHGATASTARPAGYTSVEWIGSVEPTNAINGDTWINTS